MHFQTLYCLGKKKELRVWRIWTEGSLIKTEHGVLNGKHQLAEKTAKVKNAGKVNATTPEKQAELEAQSTWRKQLDLGYFTSLEEAETTQVFLPMLADKFQDKEHKLLYPVHVQPKLNGIRCMAFWDKGKIKLLSRGNKEFNLPHITEAMSRALLSHDQVLDGELYIHGKTLQEVNRLVKKYRPGETEKLEFHNYDTFFKGVDTPWVTRYDDLIFFYKSNVVGRFVSYGRALTDIIKDVITWSASSKEAVWEAERHFVRLGYEGAIVRSLKGVYELGNRSSSLLKVKSFQDAEFKVVGYADGDGKCSGCVTWKCVTPEGREFDVVPKGTLEQRKEWFSTAEQYVGKLLTVKFFEYSEDKIPLLPTGLHFKLDIELLGLDIDL